MFFSLENSLDSRHPLYILAYKVDWNRFEYPVEAKTAHIWVKHYPKGIETIQSGIYAFTNRIETEKAVNILETVAKPFHIKDQSIPS